MKRFFFVAAFVASSLLISCASLRGSETSRNGRLSDNEVSPTIAEDGISIEERVSEGRESEESGGLLAPPNKADAADQSDSLGNPSKGQPSDPPIELEWADTFIFIRLYEITYNRSNLHWEILNDVVEKQGRADDGRNYCHSSINLTLDDSFVGITMGGANNVKVEQVMNIETNEYMRRTIPDKSTCTVFAIPCTEQDKDNVRKMLDYSLQNKFIYSIGDLFRAGFLNPQNTRNLKSFDFRRFYGETQGLDKSEEVAPDKQGYFPTNRYCCSSFICYILTKSVRHLREAFRKAELSYYGWTPSNICNMPTALRLFTCKCSDYPAAVRQFLADNPQYARYYSGE